MIMGSVDSGKDSCGLLWTLVVWDRTLVISS